MKPISGKIQHGHDWTDHQDVVAAVATGKYDGGLVYDEAGGRIKGEIEGAGVKWQSETSEAREVLMDDVRAFCGELQSNVVRVSVLADGRYDRLPNGESMMQPAASAAVVSKRFDGVVASYYTADNPSAERKGQHGKHSFALLGVDMDNPTLFIPSFLVDFEAKREHPSEQWIFDRENPVDAEQIEKLYGSALVWETYTPQVAKRCEVYHAILPAKGVPVDHYDNDFFLLVKRMNASTPEVAIRLTDANDSNWKIVLSREESAANGIKRGTEAGDVIVCSSIPYAVLPDGKARMIPTKEVYDLGQEVAAHEKRMASILPGEPEEETAAQTL